MNTRVYQKIQAVTVKLLHTNNDGVTNVGAGIRIAPNTFLTCAHVVLGVERLRAFVEEAERTPQESRPEDMWTKLKASTRSFVALGANGEEVPTNIVWLDSDSDIACIQADVSGPVASIDRSAQLAPTQAVLFFGFPYSIDTPERDWPFAVYPGMASRTVNCFVGGAKKRNYIEIAGVSFGGNSGGPVVDPASGTVIGMVHGHMVWGRDDVLIRNEANADEIRTGSTDTPVGITYATDWKLVNEITSRHSIPQK